jgi:hypothetical protein
MPLVDLLTMLGTVLTLLTLIYLSKYPHSKGEPYSRTQKLMVIPVLLGICCLLAAGFLMSARP